MQPESARYVVACDGAKSMVRRSAHFAASFEGETLSKGFVVAHQDEQRAAVSTQ